MSIGAIDVHKRATSENRSEIGDFAPTRSLWLKISGRRSRLPPIIFARIVRPMNALQVCPWQFSHRCYSWGAKSENRRFRTNAVTLIQNFRYKGSPPPIIFARLVRPMNALQLCRWQFSHKKTLYQTFFKRSAILHENRPFCVFETPFGNLGAMYDDHLRLIGKRVA